MEYLLTYNFLKPEGCTYYSVGKNEMLKKGGSETFGPLSCLQES